MTGPAVTPYGAWPSPISAGSLVTGSVEIAEVIADPVQSQYLCWAETRPEEGGRSAVMRHCLDPAHTEELTPAAANVRTLVHEYGGGAWWPHDGRLYYVEYDDQRLRRLDGVGTEPVLLTPAPPQPRLWRYADGRVTPDGHWCVCVRERHPEVSSGPGPGPVPGPGDEPINELVAVATDGSQQVETLWSEADFVMSPRLSPDGTRLAWISWDHPHMAWDATRLHVHQFDGGALGAEVVVLGRDDDRSLCQPGWWDQRLLVCSDHQDWWNLYEVDLQTGRLSEVVVGEYEVATPAWVFGMQRWAGTEAGVVAAAGRPGGDELIGIGGVGSDAPIGGVAGGSVADSAISSVTALRGSRSVACAGAGWGHESEVVIVGMDGSRKVIRPARPLRFDPGLLVEPEAITFPTTASTTPITVGSTDEASVPTFDPDCEARAHALYYRPTNPDHTGPSGELPPLLVLAHGGPTAAARRRLQPSILYWTSRGIAVVDVDYRGSTGYGRRYRQALYGGWGVVDVADCVAAARYLVDRGDADARRLMIRGSSAGGFTVMAAMASHEVFAAGASRYGIADLTVLVADTHKFESRYLDTLIGPFPEARPVYEQRSPINHVDRFSTPMIVLQGSEDSIVPPSQAEMIVAGLESRGVPVAYLLFEGEQHGFRRAETIVAALEAELAFFGQVLGFRPADDLPAVEIRGFEA